MPHQDVALAISLLSLWSKIGGSIGSAVVAVIWADQMPKQLRTCLPANATSQDIQKIFGSVTSVAAYPPDHPIRLGAVEAYRHALLLRITPAIGLAVIPLIAACFQTTSTWVSSRMRSITSETTGSLWKEDRAKLESVPASRSREGGLLRLSTEKPEIASGIVCKSHLLCRWACGRRHARSRPQWHNRGSYSLRPFSARPG